MKGLAGVWANGTRNLTLRFSFMYEKPSPLAVGSPGPVRAREPLLSLKADTKLSVRAQGVDCTSNSSWEAALSYTCAR